MNPLLRDVAEILLVVALGGMLWSAFGRARRREVRVVRCRACGRTASRAYPNCPHCGIPLS